MDLQAYDGSSHHYQACKREMLQEKGDAQPGMLG